MKVYVVYDSKLHIVGIYKNKLDAYEVSRVAPKWTYSKFEVIE